MNSIHVIRSRQILVLVLCLFFTFVSIGASGYMVYEGLSTFPEGQGQQNTCLAELKSSGFDAVETTSGLSVSHSSPDLIEQSVMQVGLVMPFCSEYTLSEFCAGSQCDMAGVSFTLLER